MGKDNPSRQLWYAHSSSIFRNHPAAVPVIGYARPLSKLTYQDILDYHSLAYVPQNMVFVVVGDVDSEKVLARVRQAMRGFDKGRDFSHQLPAVEEMLGVRRVVETNPNIKEVTAEIAFQTIPLAHEDLYALDVLSYVLSQGRSSRLVESLQRDKKLVTSISSSSWTPDWGKGVFNVSYRAEPAKADAAEDAIIAELKRVVDEGVSADELRRAKRQKQADFVYSQQSVESIASTLVSDYFSTGNVGFSRQYTSRIQEVTAEQVQQAARKYFTFDKMAVTRLEPRSEDAATAEVAVEEAKAEAPEATLIKLDNGLRVILQPVAGAGLVSMAYVSEGGLLLEDDSTNGLGSLMTVLSTRGAGDYSAEDIARFFDEAGGSVAGNTGNNSFYWQATVLEDSAAKALEIFAEIVQNPTFSEKELEIVRPLALAAIERQDEQLMSQLMRFHRGKFFSTSPYSMMPAGQKDVVSQATTQQLAAWHHKVMRAGSGVLAVYGSFDADKLAEQVSELFGDARKLPEGHIEMPEIDAPTVAEGGERFVLETDNESAAITVAVPGTSVTNLEDRFAIDVLDTIISGYRLPSGWLHRELRGRQLVYVVHAYNWLGLAPGAFMTYAIGQPENMPTIAEIIQRNLRKAADYEPTQKEIDRAVNTILTAELLGDQSISSLAIGSALDELYGLGYDFRSRLEEHYRAVKPADVLRVGRKYLSGPYAVTITTPTPENVTGSDAPVNEDQETTE
jgi:zinc protease